MTTMKVGRWYKYHDRTHLNDMIIKIKHIDYKPNGCMYGASVRYKIWTDTAYSTIGILYTSRYYWDRYAKELSNDDIIVESL